MKVFVYNVKIVIFSGCQMYYSVIIVCKNWAIYLRLEKVMNLWTSVASNIRVTSSEVVTHWNRTDVGLVTAILGGVNVSLYRTCNPKTYYFWCHNK